MQRGVTKCVAPEKNIIPYILSKIMLFLFFVNLGRYIDEVLIGVYNT
jgi:hypothetical protein